MGGWKALGQFVMILISGGVAFVGMLLTQSTRGKGALLASGIAGAVLGLGLVCSWMSVKSYLKTIDRLRDDEKQEKADSGAKANPANDHLRGC